MCPACAEHPKSFSGLLKMDESKGSHWRSEPVPLLVVPQHRRHPGLPCTNGCLLYTCDVYRTLQQLLIWSTERESDVALSHDFPQGSILNLRSTIIFVVHSLGSLLSRNYPERHPCDIFEHTAAISFIGISHGRSALASQAKISASSLGIVTSIRVYYRVLDTPLKFCLVSRRTSLSTLRGSDD